MKTRQQICKYITSQSWFNDFNYNLIKQKGINFYVYLYSVAENTFKIKLENLITYAFMWSVSADGFETYRIRNIEYKGFYYSG